MARPLLVVDLGGTNLRLALVEKGTIVDKSVVSSRTGLVQPIKEFLARTKARPERCVIGVAGPVSPDRARAQMTNLSFNIDAASLKKEIRTDVLLINDFEAMSWGVLAMGKEDLIVLSPGTPDPFGTKAVIGAGTGLGEGILFFDKAWRVTPSEGGHALLAATSEEMRDFVDFLIKKNYTSGAAFPDYECILSGHGLFSAFAFYAQSTKEDEAIVRDIESAEDKPATVSRFALEGKSKAALRALDLFVRCYAEECMNLAFKAKATGGVFIVGNIAQKNQAKFNDESFARAFLAQKMPHHSMLEFLKTIPVYLVTSTDVQLLGAGVAGKMFP